MKVRIVRVPFMLAWPPGKFAAQVILPRTIYVHHKTVLTPELIAHELAHVQQIEVLGIVPYWALYLWRLIRFGYQRHPMEVSARAYAETPDALTWAYDVLAENREAFQ